MATLDKNKEIISCIDAYVGYRVKMRRTILGLSYKELSEGIGISVAQLKKHEQGISKIYSGTLYRISQFLNVPISYFFDKAEDNMQFLFSVKASAGMLGVTVDPKEIFPLVSIYNNFSLTQ